MKKGCFISAIVFAAISTVAFGFYLFFAFGIGEAVENSQSATGAVAEAIIYAIIIGSSLIAEIISGAFCALLSGISTRSESPSISLASKIIITVVALEIAASVLVYLILL